MLEINDIIGDKIFIIAEAGVNHNGDIETANKLIDEAVEAGVDAVKFQTFNTDKLVTKNAPKADYQNETTNQNESQYDMLKKLELSKNDHEILIEYCKEKNIKFMSTPFDFESVDLLEQLGVNFFKIGSGDLTNIPLLKYIAELNKPMIVSTGMANLGEVEEAVNSIKKSGNNQLILLHCVSNYPADFKNVNLKAMNTMKIAFNLEVGYSDHTSGIEAPVAAVAMGAKVIEKHFTLNKSMKGPDHKASLNPKELTEMVESIRNVERSIGDGVKKCTKNEFNTRKISRKSITAKKNIKKGKKINENDICIKRPAKGIKPKYYDLLLSKAVTTKKINKDDGIYWKDIKII